MENNLQGSLPERICCIIPLRYLVAMDNLLRGSLPESLASLQDLARRSVARALRFVIVIDIAGPRNRSISDTRNATL